MTSHLISNYKTYFPNNLANQGKVHLQIWFATLNVSDVIIFGCSYRHVLKSSALYLTL